MAVKFRGLRHREVVLIDGPAGWGEFAPFADYSARETAPWLRSGIEAAYQGFPSPHRDYIEVNATVPAVEPTQVPEVLSRMPGARCVKVKVAEPGKDFRDALADDIARVSAVREELSGIPGTRIRVDANGAWTVEQAVEAVSALAPLDYVEQPCATPEELAEVRTQLMRRGIFVRVAADESIRRVEDPYRVADLQAADVAVVKVAPLGGVRRVLQLSADLRARHMDVTIASALDSAVGINAGLAAVASLPKLNDDEDIDVAPAPAGWRLPRWHLMLTGWPLWPRTVRRAIGGWTGCVRLMRNWKRRRSPNPTTYRSHHRLDWRLCLLRILRTCHTPQPLTRDNPYRSRPT